MCFTSLSEKSQRYIYDLADQAERARQQGISEEQQTAEIIEKVSAVRASVHLFELVIDVLIFCRGSFYACSSSFPLTCLLQFYAQIHTRAKELGGSVRKDVNVATFFSQQQVTPSQPSPVALAAAKEAEIEAAELAEQSQSERKALGSPSGVVDLPSPSSAAPASASGGFVTPPQSAPETENNNAIASSGLRRRRITPAAAVEEEGPEQVASASDRTALAAAASPNAQPTIVAQTPTGEQPAGQQHVGGRGGSGSVLKSPQALSNVPMPPPHSAELNTGFWYGVWVGMAKDMASFNARYRALFGDDAVYFEEGAVPSLIKELLRFFWVRTHWLVYLLVVINALVRPSFLTLIALLAVFLWASLSRPLPSFRFWNTLYIYILSTFVLKYVFQFRFWGKFNAPMAANDPCDGSFMRPGCLTFARFFGIYRVDDGPHFQLELLADVLLLFGMALHRLALETLGLWQ